MTGGGVSERLIALENRFQRLDLGWNQHIPGLLESMSEALDAARQAENVHRRLDAIREDLDRLSCRLELNLIALQSQQIGTSEVQRSAGVTLTMVDNKGLAVSPCARDLPFAPGSIATIAVSATYDLVAGGEGLDTAMAEWFALLAPGGRLEIERFRLAVVGDGLIGSPDSPTDDQIARALDQRGFEVVTPPMNRGAARTFVGRRPAGSVA